MLSFGFSEIALIVVVVVIVIGPKEIPNLLKHLGSFSKSLKKASRQFKNSLNDLAEENDLKEIKESINTFKDIKKNLDPTKELKEEIDSIKKTVNFTDEEVKDINSKILEDNK
tara:strand:+ start:383 stop:721 length:339 start_codon:yes stop_codon:yes gene_type:complete